MKYIGVFLLPWFVKENQENYCTLGLRNKHLENGSQTKKLKTINESQGGILVLRVLTLN